MNVFVIKLFSCSSHVIVTIPNLQRNDFQRNIYIYIYILHLLYCIYYIVFIYYIIFIKFIYICIYIYLFWDKDGQWCNGFITGFIWISTKCAASLANHLRAVADMFCLEDDSSALLNILKWTSQKTSSSNCYHTVCGESQNIYVRTKSKCTWRSKMSSNIKQFLQTLPLLYLCIYASKCVIYTLKW